MPATLPGGGARRAFWERGDLSPITRPDVTADKWDDQVRALEQLARWAEARTVETINWYLRDKRFKRLASRSLRAAAIVFAIAGAVLPLVSISTHGVNANLGYVLLAVAAGCIAFDHFYGLSAGWMRDIVAIQALQGRLARFHLEWARWESTHGKALGTASVEAAAGTVSLALDYIDDLVAEVGRITESETMQWIAEFSSAVAALRKDTGRGAAPAPDLFSWNGPADPA
ncbi:MAG TPA: SLATT domain-containing protein [Streptosporangiaceae bacterium]|nr:SLATT domain-containing protein [Streptosporangiaceae bacterium]